MCEMFAIAIIYLAPYCTPIASYAITQGHVYWKCDCTEARKDAYFLIQEAINKSFEQVAHDQ